MKISVPWKFFRHFLAASPLFFGVAFYFIQKNQIEHFRNAPSLEKRALSNIKVCLEEVQRSAAVRDACQMIHESLEKGFDEKNGQTVFYVGFALTLFFEAGLSLNRDEKPKSKQNFNEDTNLKKVA